MDPESAGINFKGRTDYRRELRKVYASHAVNLNISSLQLETSVNNRVFDCFASGGFLLSDYKEDMREIFPDFWKEITFTDIDEMNGKIAYYLARPEERIELTEKARQIVMKEHTYLQRARYIMSLIPEAQKKPRLSPGKREGKRVPPYQACSACSGAGKGSKAWNSAAGARWQAPSIDKICKPFRPVR